MTAAQGPESAAGSPLVPRATRSSVAAWVEWGFDPQHLATQLGRFASLALGQQGIGQVDPLGQGVGFQPPGFAKLGNGPVQLAVAGQRNRQAGMTPCLTGREAHRLFENGNRRGPLFLGAQAFSQQQIGVGGHVVRDRVARQCLAGLANRLVEPPLAGVDAAQAIVGHRISLVT